MIKNIDTKRSGATSQHQLKIEFSSFFSQPSTATLEAMTIISTQNRSIFVPGSALAFPLRTPLLPGFLQGPLLASSPGPLVHREGLENHCMRMCQSYHENLVSEIPRTQALSYAEKAWVRGISLTRISWYDWRMHMQWFPDPSPCTRGPGDEPIALSLVARPYSYIARIILISILSYAFPVRGSKQSHEQQ